MYHPFIQKLTYCHPFIQKLTYCHPFIQKLTYCQPFAQKLTYYHPLAQKLTYCQSFAQTLTYCHPPSNFVRFLAHVVFFHFAHIKRSLSLKTSYLQEKNTNVVKVGNVLEKIVNVVERRGFHDGTGLPIKIFYNPQYMLHLPNMTDSIGGSKEGTRGTLPSVQILSIS